MAGIRDLQDMGPRLGGECGLKKVCWELDELWGLRREFRAPGRGNGEATGGIIPGN